MEEILKIWEKLRELLKELPEVMEAWLVMNDNKMAENVLGNSYPIIFKAVQNRLEEIGEQMSALRRHLHERMKEIANSEECLPCCPIFSDPVAENNWAYGTISTFIMEKDGVEIIFVLDKEYNIKYEVLAVRKSF